MFNAKAVSFSPMSSEQHAAFCAKPILVSSVMVGEEDKLMLVLWSNFSSDYLATKISESFLFPSHCPSA